MKTRYHAHPFTSLVTWLTLGATLLGALVCNPSFAETKTVVAEGKSDYCYAREIAQKLARVGAENDAHNECNALGSSWRYTGQAFSGYEQCTACGNSGQFKCTVKQATYKCTSMQKENEEKAAKERAEKAAKAKAAREKADQEKVEQAAKAKAAKEKAEREHAEKEAKAKAIQAAKDKAQQEKIAKQRAEKQAAVKAAKEKSDREKAEHAIQVKAAKEKDDRERAAKESSAKKVAQEKARTDKFRKERADQEAIVKKKAAHTDLNQDTQHKSKKSENDSKQSHKLAKSKQPESGVSEDFLDGPSSGGNEDKSISDLLDEDAERPQIQKRLEQERAVYRHKADVACQNTLRTIDNCFAKTSCKRPGASPSRDECGRIPAYPSGDSCATTICLTVVHHPEPGEVCYHDDDECKAEKARIERKKEQERADLTQKQSAWDSRYDAIWQQCKMRRNERDEYAKCQQQYAPACNPGGIESLDACVGQQMKTSGPTEQDARAHLKKEWDAKARASKNVLTNKKEIPTTNFLD